MALKLVKRNKARVHVKGTINGDDGAPEKFDFVLLCKRVDQQEIDAFLEDKKTTIVDFMHKVTEDWETVMAGDGTPLEFSADNLSVLMAQPGMHVVCFNAYIKEIGAVAKN